MEPALLGRHGCDGGWQARFEGLPSRQRTSGRAAGLIQYIRGSVRILDRSGLETLACGCYRVVRDEHARLLDH